MQLWSLGQEIGSQPMQYIRVPVLASWIIGLSFGSRVAGLDND